MTYCDYTFANGDRCILDAAHVDRDSERSRMAPKEPSGSQVITTFNCSSPAFPYMPLRQFFAVAAVGGALVPTHALKALRERESRNAVSIEELNTILRSAEDRGCYYFPELIVYPTPKIAYTTASGRYMYLTSVDTRSASMYMTLADNEVTYERQQGSYLVDLEPSHYPSTSQMPERWQLRATAALQEREEI